MTANALATSSRYARLETLNYEDPSGRTVAYYPVRFIAAPARRSSTQECVQVGDRPDLLAFRAYADPLAFYRIADHNGCPNPFELTVEPGRNWSIPYLTP
ncbi:MAG: hypothetical protein JKP96_04815 [Oceanicaulis sp.]|nr:hypothetical protein [Oceanicaulis sp.]